MKFSKLKEYFKRKERGVLFQMPLTLENFHPQTDVVLHPHVWNMPHGSPELGFTCLDFSLISTGRKGGSHWDC